jgi:hypothetical protein
MTFPNTLLTLKNPKTGDFFAFGRFEIPESINFGGEQRMTVHERVGGSRVVDVMGASPDDIEWSGHFVGAQGLSRAQYIDGIRKSGQKWVLSWSKLRFEVVIKSFKCDFKQFYRLNYRIAFEVVQDLTRPVLSKPMPSVDQLIGDDFGALGIFAGSIDDEVLTSALMAANLALTAAGNLKNASPSALLSIGLPLAAAGSQISTLMAQNNSAISGFSSVGGVTAGASAANQSTGLAGQTSAVNMGINLLGASTLIGRIQNNLRTIGK